MLIRACSGGRWVHSGSLDSLACAQSLVKVFQRRWVHLRAPCVSLGLSGIVGFTDKRLGGLWLKPGSLGSFACILGVIGFIRGLWVHSRVP